MRPYPWLKVAALTWLVLAFGAVICPASPAVAEGAAQAEARMQDQELAETYAPVLYFHPDELFRPQSVDAMLSTARLQRARPFWPDTLMLRHVTSSDLSRYSDGSYYLNTWLGDEASSDYKSYSAHRAYYRSTLSPQAGGPPAVAYARVVRDETPQRITIQYWLFYWYNDAFNKHEGDWEMVQVILSATGEPEWLVLTQHHGGTRRPWGGAQVETGTHPAAYVALGSHANYFWGDEVYLASVTIGNACVRVADRTGTAGPTVPKIVLIPDREEIGQDPARWAGLEWLLFRGGWGEQAPQGDFSGPLGPADKGEQWDRPYLWGMAQPLDAEAWYANRLRVEAAGLAGANAQVHLRASGGDPLDVDEPQGGLALLHAEPPTGSAVLADIAVSTGGRHDLVVTWPDENASQVFEYRFENVLLGAEDAATLLMRPGEAPLLMVEGVPHGKRPTVAGSRAVFWNAPDVVWALGLLPGSDVLWGAILSLLAGLLPPLVYVAVLYWVDQYEKEPVRLLAAAFLWGAVPALLVAVAVRVFFRLPPSLLGPSAIQLVSSGVVTPLIEEALVGAAVLFVAWRYRHEFDDVLDGIIYGAVAGLGFAMTANILGYLGAFVQFGLSSLGRKVLVDGFQYGLNQALYAAILGAGVGYAQLARRRWRRWAVPLAAFVLAVVIRGLHNLAIDNSVGWNLRTLALTWAGFLVLVAVAAWSLRQQRRCLAAELAGEVPDALYGWLVRPGGCWLAEGRALRRGGLRGLVRLRRATQCCTRLAFRKMQSRQPGESTTAGEISALRQEVARAVGAAPLELLS